MLESMPNQFEKMNILLGNYRYFVSGGPERYLFNVSELLEKKGHILIPFSVKHPKNVYSEFSRFFLSPLSTNKNEIFLKEFIKNPLVWLKLFDRAFYSIEAKRKIKTLLDKFNIDVAYILHFLRWISPSIIDELYNRNIPIVVRISDFEYICPGAHLLRNNQICELCLNGNYWNAIKYRCVQNSLSVSLTLVFSMYINKWLKIFNKIDAFICPSEFTLEKMVEAGFDRGKLFYVPTFINSEKINPNFNPGNYILYLGRLSHEKGVDVLLDSLKKLQGKKNISLTMIVQSAGLRTDTLHKRITTNGIENIKILSDIEKENIYSYIRNSAFVIVPSIHYENLPNVILESFAHGKSVIGSNRGGINDIVKHQETGLLFEAGNSDDLAEKIDWLMNNPSDNIKMGLNARRLVEEEFNQELHYQRLMEIFKKFREEHKNINSIKFTVN